MSGSDKALAERIAGLDPKKRRLLEMMAKRREEVEEGSAPVVEANPDPLPAPAAEVVLADHFTIESGRLPALDEVGSFYDAINGQLDATQFGAHALFLNYGYVPNGTPHYAAHRLPEVFFGRNAARLVLEVIADTEVDGRHRVLDVGCGRGGTLSIFHRFFSPGRMLGIDLSPKAIAFCRATHRFPNGEFLVGNAEALAVADGSFDVVTNIESSHTYNDLDAFYRETARVLSPGGHFLYTDLMPTDLVETNIAKLESLGYVLERKRDITPNVLLSCDETAATHARAFAEENDNRIMRNFLAVPGSELYDDMKNGKTRYVLLKLRKV
ncbi:class I SAM-dependent methyltransferase [Endothiovibrio diazotrophicus]